MNKQILIVGLGRLGLTLAGTLFDMGHDVLAIDNDQRKVQEAAGHITHAVTADATSETVLRELGAGNFDIAIVTTGSEVEASVLATILLKKLGVPYIIARANSDLHGAILDRIGADKVIYPEKESGLRIAREIEKGGISDFIPLTEKYGVTKIKAPDDFAGEKLGNLGIGTRERELAVLLIQHLTATGQAGEVIVGPGVNEIIRAGDVLVISGETARLEQVLSDFRKRNVGGK